jgi:hypothetical protein
MSATEHPVELSVPQLLQEVIIGGAFASAQRNLPADAMSLVALLPLSTITHVVEVEVKVSSPALYKYLFLHFMFSAFLKLQTICRKTEIVLNGDVQLSILINNS